MSEHNTPGQHRHTTRPEYVKRPKEHVEVTKNGSPLRHRIKAKEKNFLRHVTWPENIHRSNHEKRRGPLRDGSQLGAARRSRTKLATLARPGPALRPQRSPKFWSRDTSLRSIPRLHTRCRGPKRNHGDAGLLLLLLHCFCLLFISSCWLSFGYDNSAGSNSPI